MSLKIEIPRSGEPLHATGVIDGCVPVCFTEQNGEWILRIGESGKAWTHRSSEGDEGGRPLRNFIYQAVALYRCATRDNSQRAA